MNFAWLQVESKSQEARNGALLGVQQDIASDGQTVQ